jgi:DNA-binding SARP family transcriptional activator
MKGTSSRGRPLICLLGPVTIDGEDGPQPVPGRSDRAVLVHLTLSEARAVSVDLLIDALWPEEPPAGARNALQVKVSRLRNLLGAQAHRLTYAQGAYRLQVSQDDTDVGRFAASVERGEAALREKKYADALAELECGLQAWQGTPLAEFAHHPRVVAARSRLAELYTTALEAHAEARLTDPVTRTTAIADLRSLLEREPLRPRARRALMWGLELGGRRAEALAIYDAGRRLFSQTTGLEPPVELRAAFERLLLMERRTSRRAATLQRAPRAVPDSLLDTVQWLADDGDPVGGLQLAVRGAWWWWTAGSRGRARELLEDLLERCGEEGAADGPAQLTARAWLGVFRSTTAQAAVSLDSAEQSLQARGRPPWSRHDALCAVLIAERLFDRGDPMRGNRLLGLARRYYAHAADDWGQSLCGTVAARGQLLAGDVIAAHAAALARLAEFAELGDPAGQLMALDLLGYCSEVRGDLHTARSLHERALDLARQHGSPDWEAAQLTRLGSVGVLGGTEGAMADLNSAARITTEIRSETIAALCHNGLGVALHLSGDSHGARSEHLAAWSYYSHARSSAGLAYTGARLALLSPVGGTARGWAVESLHHAVPTRDPRAVAHSLEALSLVADDLHEASAALGAAAALRQRSSAPLPERQREAVDRRRKELSRQLGKAFASAWREGVADPVGTAAAW